jgi:hypothetical protein
MIHVIIYLHVKGSSFNQEVYKLQFEYESFVRSQLCGFVEDRAVLPRQFHVTSTQTNPQRMSRAEREKENSFHDSQFLSR